MKNFKNVNMKLLTKSESKQVLGGSFPIPFPSSIPVIDPKNPIFDPAWGWIGSGPGGSGVGPLVD